MVDDRPAACSGHVIIGLTLSAALLAGGATHAQIVVPDPNGADRQTPTAQAAQPANVRVVQGSKAWVLELVEPKASADLAATAQAPAARQGRFRAVPTPGGAWLIVDDDAPALEAAQMSSSHASAVARTTAAGVQVLELPGTTVQPAARATARLRTVEVRNAEDVARAMTQPEPDVVYRIVR